MTLWRLAFQYAMIPLANQLSINEYKFEARLPSFATSCEKWQITALKETFSEWVKVKEKLKKDKKTNKEKKDRMARENGQLNTLDPSYSSPPSSNVVTMDALAEQTKLSKEKITEYWIYFRRKTTLDEFVHKYIEEFWKTLTTLTCTLYGVWLMPRHECFWNPRVGFSRYPQLENTQILIYYGLASGYHGHRATFQFFDHRRKDFVV